MAKIIVADMDEHLLMLYSEELKETGYDVTACNDGQEVINALKKRDADVLVLDIEMLKYVSFHSENGTGNQAGKPAAVIITSHESQEAFLQPLMDANIIVYHVRKSFCLQTLKEKVAEALKMHGSR